MSRSLAILVVMMSVALSASSAVSRPFIMPIAATVHETSKDGKGWQETGVARMTYVQAVGQFKASLAQSGWKFQHAVSLSSRNDRSLLAWKKGNRELTMMLWRIDVGRSGFSWGVSSMDQK